MADSEPAITRGTETLRTLFPATVCCAWSESGDPDFALLPGETATTVAMSPGRLREFRHGRQCARAALAELGHPDQPLPVGPGRAPVWPPGVVGSLAHHAGIAAAAAAPAEHFAGIGIDIEPFAPVDADLVPLFATPAELNALQALGDEALAARLIFSGKESVFKCIWPQLGRYIDFLDVTLAVTVTGLARGHFRMQATTLAGNEAAACARLQGRYAIVNNLLLTGAVIAASAPDRPGA